MRQFGVDVPAPAPMEFVAIDEILVHERGSDEGQILTPEWIIAARDGSVMVVENRRISGALPERWGRG